MRWASLLLAGSWLSSEVHAQTLDDLRESLRDAAQASRYATFFTTLAGIASDGQLSLGALEIDTDPGTELLILALPWSRDLEADESGRSLRLEVTAGYSSARIDFEDLWSGDLPGLETGVRTRFEAWAVDSGLGVNLPLGAGIVLRPLVRAGLAYIQNSASFSGPGADLTSALTDGILFNWNELYYSYGGSLELLRRDWKSGDVELRPRLRYDLRQWEGIDVEERALESDDITHWLTARFDVTGPFGASQGDHELDWETSLGYRRLFGESVDQLGFADFFELGVGVTWATGGESSFLSALRVSAAVQLGADVSGFSFGLSASL